MTYQTIEVRPLTPTVGAEIHGVKLSEPLGNQQFQEIHDALMQHQVVFFRDQDMTLEQHKDFGRRFGPLHIHPSAPGPEGHPEVLKIHADENSKQVAGHRWHSDVSCDPEPPMGSILHLHTIPPSGGDTLFASSIAAYEALSEPMKKFLGELTARHDGSPNYHRRARVDGRVDTKQYPFADHPVIRTHPVTGKKGIFVNPVFTQYIIGIPDDESKAILEFLYAHTKQERFVCRFSWEKDSVAFWDNRAVQHLAMWDYFPQVRSGFRVTVAGDKPF
jgi:taurine dioxygenase